MKEKEKEKRRGRERGDQAKIKRYGTLDFWYGNYLDHGIE